MKDEAEGKTQKAIIILVLELLILINVSHTIRTKIAFSLSQPVEA